MYLSHSLCKGMTEHFPFLALLRSPLFRMPFIRALNCITCVTERICSWKHSWTVRDPAHLGLCPHQQARASLMHEDEPTSSPSQKPLCQPSQTRKGHSPHHFHSPYSPSHTDNRTTLFFGWFFLLLLSFTICAQSGTNLKTEEAA